MATGAELGTAYVSILADSKGLGSGLRKEFGQVERDAEATGKNSGNRFSAAFSKWAKRAVAVGAAAVGAAAGAAIVTGFRSAVDQQQGEAVLSGLYGDAEKAASTLEGLKRMASGSPIDYSAYQDAAGSLAYAGVEGEQTIGVLENVGLAITAAGGDSSNMDRATDAILKGVNAGKFQLDTLQQLSDAGVPVLSGLAEHLGVPMETVNKMASAGEIALEDVIAVMENATGDTFQQMLGAGESASEAFSNQWKMAKDNISVALGETMLPLIEKITPLIEPMGEAVVDAIERLPEIAENVKGAVEGAFGWIGDNMSWIKPLAFVIGGIAAAFGIYAAAMGIASGATTVFGAALNFALGPVNWVIIGIGLLVGALVWFFTQTELGQEIWEKVWSAIKTAAGAVWDWIKNTLWPGILTAWDAIATGAIWLYDNAIKPAWDGIKTGIDAVWTWIRDTLWPGIQGAWEAIGNAATWLYESVIQPVWNGIKLAIAIVVTAILLYVDYLVWAWETLLAPVAMWLWNNVMKPAWEGIKSAIGAVVDWFQNTAWPALQSVIDWIGDAFNWLRDALDAAWTFIRNKVINPVIQWFQNTVWPLIDKVIGWIELAFEGWKIILGAVWDFVQNRIINPVITWFRDTAWPMIDTVLGHIETGFNVMRDALKAAWDFIKDRIINPVATWFRDTIGPLFDRATDGVSDAFGTMKDAISTAWEAIKDTAKAPIRFVVETIVNDALIGNFNKVAEKLGVDTLPNVNLPSGFARGGVLPGMSRMRDGDDQLVPMRRGEGVLVSEGLRTAKDRSAFMAANAAGRRGIGFASLMGGGFAGGGILGDAWRGAKSLAGDALDKVLEGVDFVAEAITNPRGMFDKVYNSVVGNIPAAGLMTDVAKGAGKKVLDGVVDSVMGAFGPGSAGDVGDVPAGASRSLSYARQVASAHGLTMTSFRRGGARTAGSGAVSLHALGRAMDFSNSSGPTPQMMRFFNAMHPLRPTELLYSPAGGRQWRRSGRMADTSGATKRGHYNHVHVGFNKGGIFDQGGMLQPGQTGINLTRKPEAVLDPAQTRWLQQMASRETSSVDGQTIVQVIPPSNEDPGMWGRRVADSLDLHRLRAVAGGA